MNDFVSLAIFFIQKIWVVKQKGCEDPLLSNKV